MFYPGLESCRGHQYAKELFSGFGGVVALEFVGGEQMASTFIHVSPYVPASFEFIREVLEHLLMTK